MAKRRLGMVIATVCVASTLSLFAGAARAQPPACAAGSTIMLGAGSSVCGVPANRPGVIAYKGIAYATAGPLESASSHAVAAGGRDRGG